MNRLIISALIILIAITSCTVYKEYPIDVYKPGPVKIDQRRQNVVLVYRDFKYTGDTLQHYYKSDYKLFKAKNDPKNIDSVMVMTCLNNFAKTLKTNANFNEIKIIPFNVFNPHSGGKLPNLDFDIVKKLTDATQSDLLITLETFSYFYSKYSGNYESRGSEEVFTVAVWGVYDPEDEKLIERKSMIDTLYWNPYDEQGNYQNGYKPPPRLTALKIASATAGEKYAKRFYASWQTVDRMYSIPPLPDFSQAAAYFEEGKWDNAIVLWKKYADDRNGKMAINARYNIALTYEIKDEIEVAIKWLNAARDLAVKMRSKKDLKQVFEYQKKLIQRKKEIDRLNQE